MKTLITAAELLQRLQAGKATVVLDCGFELSDPAAGERAWRAGHLPGALYVHLDHDLAGPKQDRAGRFRGRHPLPERDVLARRLGALRHNAGVERGLLRRPGWALRFAGLVVVALDGPYRGGGARRRRGGLACGRR